MDLDGDGRRDILSGSYSREDRDMAGLFQVLYGQPDGTFRKAEVLKGTDGEPLIIPHNDETDVEAICTRPFAVDWDGDARFDLVVGTYAGTFYWFKGAGQGAFQPKPQQLQAGKKPLVVKDHHGDPFVIDWDGDGDLDLLSGSSEGGVEWAENIAGRGKLPELRPFQMLLRPGRTIKEGEVVSEDDLTGPASSTRVWVADVNGDGKLDVLIGDSVTLAVPAKGVSAETFKQKLADWQTAFANASQALRAAKGDKAAVIKAREAVRKLLAERSGFMIEDDTGFVWLYLQK